MTPSDSSAAYEQFEDQRRWALRRVAGYENLVLGQIYRLARQAGMPRGLCWHTYFDKHEDQPHAKTARRLDAKLKRARDAFRLWERRKLEELAADGNDQAVERLERLDRPVRFY